MSSNPDLQRQHDALAARMDQQEMQHEADMQETRSQNAAALREAQLQTEANLREAHRQNAAALRESRLRTEAIIQQTAAQTRAAAAAIYHYAQMKLGARVAMPRSRQIHINALHEALLEAQLQAEAAAAAEQQAADALRDAQMRPRGTTAAARDFQIQMDLLSQRQTLSIATMHAETQNLQAEVMHQSQLLWTAMDGMQERINRLDRRHRRQDREFDEMEREARAMRERIDGLKNHFPMERNT